MTYSIQAVLLLSSFDAVRVSKQQLKTECWMEATEEARKGLLHSLAVI